jgi:uncharacterized membrane protein YedE/YeeE
MYIGSRCVRYISPIIAGDRGNSLLYYGGWPDHGTIPCSIGVDLMKLVIALIAGMLFGGGLVVSGMTDTAKVQGWLDVFGAWDPTLAFVMGGAMIPMAIAWILTKSRSPMTGGNFPAPPEPKLGRNLIVGSVLFGMGWALAGLCPGPSIAAISFGGTSLWIFLVAMGAGMFVAPRVRAMMDA